MRGSHKRKAPEGFGDRLQDAIYKSGLSTTEIERQYDVNHSNLNAYVNGDMSPTVPTLAVLCKALRVSADYLLFGGAIWNI